MSESLVTNIISVNQNLHPTCSKCHQVKSFLKNLNSISKNFYVLIIGTYQDELTGISCVKNVIQELIKNLLGTLPTQVTQRPFLPS